jgi:hypothetical protein
MTFLLAAVCVLLLAAPTMAQAIPGSAGWLLSPTPGHSAASPAISETDATLIRCYRKAIATGQYFLGDANYVLAQCERPLAAWVAECEARNGRSAAICLLGPQQAVGNALHDAWAHHDNLKGWLAAQPPLPDVIPDRN